MPLVELALSVILIIFIIMNITTTMITAIIINVKVLLWSCASLQYVAVGICSWENRKRIKLHVNCEF